MQIEDTCSPGAGSIRGSREHPPAFEWLNNWPPMEISVGAPSDADDGPRTRGGRRRDRRAARAPSTRSTSAPPPTASSTRREGIPAIVYGPGDLKIAHCKDEFVLLDEVAIAAKALARRRIDWCGVA